MDRGRTYEGAIRLRNAFMLGLTSSLTSLILMVVNPGGEILASLSSRGIAVLLTIVILGMATFILAIASWIYRVLGWGSLCKASIKRFYCYTRIAIIVLPAAGTLLTIVGSVALSFQVMAGGPQAESAIESLPKGLMLAIHVGAVVFVTGFIMEGLSLLDMSLIYGRRILTAGSILYLLAQVLSIAGNSFQRVPGTLTRIVDLVAYTILAMSLAGLGKSLL